MLKKTHRRLTFASAVLGAIAMLAPSASAAPGAACGVCGKNLIKNPGAEAGAGVTSVGAFGAVPGWTNEMGQFTAASYSYPFWFHASTKTSPKRGKNYFFGGTTVEANNAKATIGTQTIKLPAAAAGRKAMLSGWLGNYGSPPSANMAQVRAQFEDASGKLLAAIRIGPDTTITGSSVMALRTRKGTVPAGAAQVTIVVTFRGGTRGKLAGVDDLSLVLT